MQCVQCLWDPEEGVGRPGIWSFGTCELPDTGSGNQTPQDPLKEKHMLLTTELSLLGYIFDLYDMMKLVFISCFQSWLHIGNF